MLRFFGAAFFFVGLQGAGIFLAFTYFFDQMFFRERSGIPIEVAIVTVGILILSTVTASVLHVLCFQKDRHSTLSAAVVMSAVLVAGLSAFVFYAGTEELNLWWYLLWPIVTAIIAGISTAITFAFLPEKD